MTDARSNTKIWLDTYLRPAQLTKDDGVTWMDWAVLFDDVNYPMSLEFRAPSAPIDVMFLVCKPATTPLRTHDGTIYGYKENVPIEIYAIDKTGVTATKAVWTAEAELRYVAKNYPEGSQRDLSEGTDISKNLGSTLLPGRRFILSYERDTT